MSLSPALARPAFVSLALVVTLVTLATLAGAAIAGCGRGQAEKAEAERVLRSVDALIKADREAKAEPLAALAAEPCEAETVCKLRQACVSAFEPMVRAMNLKAQVRDALRGEGARDGDELTRKLEQAEQDLGESKRRMDGCTSATTTVRQAYRL